MKNDQLLTKQRWGDQQAVSLYIFRGTMYGSELFAELKWRVACMLFDKAVKM